MLAPATEASEATMASSSPVAHSAMEGSTRSIPGPTLGCMATGKRRPRGRPRSAGNPFYERFNRVFDEAGFDAFAEEQCAKFSAERVGRPSLAPTWLHQLGPAALHRDHSDSGC